MKKMKQFAALLIAFAVVAASGIFSVSVLAEDSIVSDESTAVVEIAEADKLLVEKLEAFGIVKDIEADLTAKITRREMTEIITDYMRIPDAKVDFETSPFIDVPASDRSIGSIMALYNMKVVTGDDTMRFYPDANLNYDEALVFVVNAIGYKLFAVRDGGFPTGYHRVAIKLGLLKNLSMQSGRDEITRLGVYKLLEAGLKAAAVTYGIYTEDETQYTVSSTDDFLSDTHGITTHKGIITGNEDTYLTNATSKMTDEQIEIDYTLYDTPGYIYATSLGRSVIYYLRDDNNGGKEIAYIEENDEVNSVVKIDSRDILVGQTTDTRIYYTDAENKEYHVDFIDGVDVIYNGRVYRGYGNIANALPAAGYIEALDNNGDDVADIMFVYAYRNVLVRAIDTYKNEVVASDGSRISCDIESGNARVYVMPKMSKGALKDVKVDSIASVLESKGTPKLTTIYVSTDKVEGTISEVLSDGTIIIDGVNYKKAVGYAGIPLTAGTNVSLKMDYNGYIAYGDYGASDSAAAEIGVFAGIEYEHSTLANSISLRIYTKNKTFIVTELTDPVYIDDQRYDLTDSVEFDNALKYLSKNQKNDEQRYVLTEAKIITYKLDNGKIARVDTGETGKPGNLRILENNASRVLCRPNSSVLTINQALANQFYGIYNSSKILVFTAPYNNPSTSANEVLNEAGYSYGHTLNERVYAINTSGSVDYVNTQETAVYSLSSNSSGIETVDVLLFRGSSLAATATGGMPSDSSKFNLITKINTALDKDGMSCKKMYFGTESKLLADTIRFIDGGGDHGNLPVTHDKITGLKPGYVIQYSMDADGKIAGIRVISNFNKANDGTVTVTYQYNHADYTKGTKCAAGRIDQNSPADNAIVIDPFNSSESNYFGKVAGKIYIYHSADGELVEATQSELIKDDIIVAHIATYHSYTEVFVIR